MAVTFLVQMAEQNSPSMRQCHTLKKKKKKLKLFFFLFFFPNGHFKDGKKKRQMTSLRQGSRKCTHMCVYFCKRERERVVLATVPEKELQSLL